MKRILMIVMMLLLAACDDGPPPKSPADAKPRKKTYVAAQKEQEAAEAIISRAKMATTVAFDAVKSVPDGMKELEAVTGRCPYADDDEVVADPKKMFVIARCALMILADIVEMQEVEKILKVESRVTRAEELAQAATRSAELRVAQAKEKELRDAKDAEKKEEELEAVFVAAKPICDRDRILCKKRCDAGGPSSIGYCVFTANKFVVENKFDDAIKALQIACSAQAKQACELIPKIEATKAGFGKKKEAVFGDVATIADDIASKMFIATTATKIGGRAARAVPRMRLVIEASIRETYCPAKKEAMAVLTAAEFSKLAATHCKDEPPTAGGLSGSQVPLPNECRQVFASSCP